MVFYFRKVGDTMFTINGIEWRIIWVNPNSADLMRSDGSITVGMTDWQSKSQYTYQKLSKGHF